MSGTPLRIQSIYLSSFIVIIILERDAVTISVLLMRNASLGQINWSRSCGKGVWGRGQANPGLSIALNHHSHCHSQERPELLSPSHIHPLGNLLSATFFPQHKSTYAKSCLESMQFNSTQPNSDMPRLFIFQKSLLSVKSGHSSPPTKDITILKASQFLGRNSNSVPTLSNLSSAPHGASGIKVK